MPTIIDKLVGFKSIPSGLGITHTQYLPESFVSDLKRDKMDSLNTPTGDFYRVASIPVSVVEDLLKNHNFDVMREPAAATIKMLKKLHLDAFVTTNKRV